MNDQMKKEMENIAQQVFNRNTSRSQFSPSSTTLHTHNGIDSPQINQEDVLPNTRLSGSITFSQSTIYQIGVNFNPTSIWFYGEAVNNDGSSPTIRAHCIGNAQLGPSFYLQPSSTTSVVVGGPTQNIIQSSSMLLIDSSTTSALFSGLGTQYNPTVRAIVDEGHLVDVEYGGILARATILSYENGVILIDVFVASTWQIIGNLVIT